MTKQTSLQISVTRKYASRHLRQENNTEEQNHVTVTQYGRLKRKYCLTVNMYFWHILKEA